MIRFTHHQLTVNSQQSTVLQRAVPLELDLINNVRRLNTVSRKLLTGAGGDL